MADVSHRTIEEDVFDGSSGEKIATKRIEQLGATFDGVFVPFISKEGSYIDRLVKDGKAAQQAEQGTTEPQATQPAPPAEEL